MEYIKLENISKYELLLNLDEITSNGRIKNEIFEFLSNHGDQLNGEKYITINEEKSNDEKGSLQWSNSSATFNINVKKSMVMLLAFLLDLNGAYGTASFSLSAIGYSSQVIYKIEENEKCILLDTMTRLKKHNEDYLYFEKECVHKDINCSFRSEEICRRNIDDTSKIIDVLIEKEVLHKKNSVIKIAF